MSSRSRCMQITHASKMKPGRLWTKVHTICPTSCADQPVRPNFVTGIAMLPADSFSAYATHKP